jgi:hypothetical protein
VVHGELLGEPSAELRAKLADSDVPVLFMPYQSMKPPLGRHASADVDMYSKPTSGQLP